MDVLLLKNFNSFNSKNMNSGTCVHSPIETIRSKNRHQQHQQTSNNIDEIDGGTSGHEEPELSIHFNFDRDEYYIKNFYELMKYERLRIVTYILYDHQWPKMDIISPASLAKAGFFYYKNDSVCCAFCRGKVRNWEKGMFIAKKKPKKNH